MAATSPERHRPGVSAGALMSRVLGGGPPRPWSADALRIAALIAFALIAYWPSLGVPFVFDDLGNIVLNARVQPESLAELPRALDARGSRDRPVAMVTFALNYLWGGLDPSSYHAVNLAIHAANGVVLFLLLRLLAAAPGSPAALGRNAAVFAFAGALIWVVHPVNTQAVTYIVQRMASLAALFYLLALLAFVLWRLGRVHGRWALPAIVLVAAAGFFTKAHVVTLPAALLLVDVVFFGGFRRAHGWALAGVGVAAAVLGAVYAGSAFEHLIERPGFRDFSGVERLMTQGRVIWHYVSLLAWPAADRLQLDYDFAISRSLLEPPTTLVAAAALAAVTAAAVVSLRRWSWPGFGWLFFLLALSVESSVLLLEIAFEHRLYLPAALLLPAAIAPVYARMRPGRGPALVSVVVLVVAAVLTLQTLERNAQWANAGGLWRADLERGASPFRAALNGALRLAQQGRPDDALALLEHMPHELDRSERGRLRQARGEILFMRGRYADALTEFRAALALYPLWTRAAYSLGQCLIQLGRLDDARSVAQELTEQVPDSAFAAVLSAELAHERGDLAEAQRILRAFLAERDGLQVPARNLVRLHLANIHRAQGRPVDAAEQYRAVIDADPKQWAAWANLYHMLRAGGSIREADRVARYLERHGVEPGAWASPPRSPGAGEPLRAPDRD